MHRQLLALAPSVLLTGVVLAQATTAVTVNNGSMSFTQSALSATSNTYVAANMRSTGAAGADHLFSTWWWYRVSGDNQETAFQLDAAPNTPTRVVSGSNITTAWPDVAGRGIFSANLADDLVSTGPASGYLRRTMVVTNIGAAPLTIDVFAYTDWDVNINTPNDAFGNERSHYVLRPTLTPGAEFYCEDADQTMVTPWVTSATAGQLPGLLANNTVDNLTGWTGSLIGMDYNGAFQWQRTIAPNARETFTVYLAITDPGCMPDVTLYGASGAGTPGVPVIGQDEHGLQDPTQGVSRSFDITLDNAAATAPALLLAGFSQGNQVVAGLTIHVNLASAVSLIHVTDPSGSAGQTIGLPNTPNLCGLSLFSQWLVLDAGGVSGIASFTQGLDSRIGSW